MARIEDYALLGDLQTAALVDRDGSVDWLCFPRFDSGACFAALLGGPDCGCWLLAPSAPATSTRRYLHDTLVLETTWKTEDGSVARVLDFMPPRGKAPDIVRIVEGVKGRVHFRSELTIRFDYGRDRPVGSQAHARGEHARRARRPGRALLPHACARPAVRTCARSRSSRSTRASASRSSSRGSRRTRTSRRRSTRNRRSPTPRASGGSGATRARSTCRATRRALVRRSLIVLKALTYDPTGGIVAAPTTSLPEWIGSVRNWDYRYCWLRDATLTLLALLHCNHADEAGRGGAG